MYSNVKVIAVTTPVIPELETPDDVVAFAARVSNPANQANTNTAPRLLKYLKDHAHWSPFEMAHCVMEIETTRDIARQILRHRSFAFQEFSQRYADVAQLGDMFVERECRLQDTKNRQNSIELFDESEQEGDEFDQKMSKLATWIGAQRDVIETSQAAYQWALENGIAKEQARVVLPEGLTKSRLYMSGSLRSWMHYCDLRRANGTQKEHMEVAEKCWQELLKYFPSLQEG